MARTMIRLAQDRASKLSLRQRQLILDQDNDMEREGF
jgi:hypothetical protein